MADTNGNGKAERWLKWAVGLALGCMVWVVGITRDYADFKARTEEQLRSQGEERKAIAENQRFQMEQHAALIQLLQLHDRDVPATGRRYEAAPPTPGFSRGQMFDK